MGNTNSSRQRPTHPWRRRGFPLLLALAMTMLLSACADGFFFGDPPSHLMAGQTPPPSAAPTPQPSDSPPQQSGGLAYTPVNRFQPLSEKAVYNRQLIPLCYEGLFAPDENFTPRPLLCKSMKSDDNRLFQLTLHTNRRFWDGSFMTVEDVVYSFALAAAGVYGDRLQGVTMAANGDDGLTMESSAPLFNAAALLDFPIIKENTGESRVAVGTGVYQLRFTGGEAYLWANSHHPDAADLTQSRIELLPVTEEQTLGYWFGNGFLGMVTLDLQDSLSPGLGAGYERRDLLSTEFHYFAFNHTKDWTQDAAIRRVCALALNREGLCTMAFGALAQAAVVPLPSVSELMPTGFRPIDYNLQEAAALLTELGFADEDKNGVLERREGRRDEELSLIFIVRAGRKGELTLARAYVKALASLRIHVQLMELSDHAYAAALEKGDYHIAAAQSVLAPNFDPAVFAGRNAPLSFGYNGGAEMQSLLTALHEAPAHSRTSALGAVYRKMTEDVVLLPVGFRLHSVCSAHGFSIVKDD